MIVKKPVKVENKIKQQSIPIHLYSERVLKIRFPHRLTPDEINVRLLYFYLLFVALALQENP